MMVTSLSAASVLASAATTLPTLVVLPTYNEVDNIARTLDAILAVSATVEILVVDDSSPDGTASVARDRARDQPGRVHVLDRRAKDGLGAAYRAGFQWALERGYEIIVQMDADGSHPADRLPALVAAVSGGQADLAVGSRYVAGGGTRNWSLSRRLLSRGANLYARSMLGLSQRDLTGGFRAWRREALLAADPTRSATCGYGFLVELAVAAHCSGVRVVELPITFVDRVYGDSKMTRGIAIEGMRMVWRLRGTRRTVRQWEPAMALAS